MRPTHRSAPGSPVRVPGRSADRGRGLHQAHHTRLADPHPATERHLHAGTLARVHHRRRRVGGDARPLRANVTVPPAPAGAALDTANRSKCSRSPMPAADHTLSAWVEHALRTARPGLAFPPVRHLLVEQGQVEPALGAGLPHLQPIAGVVGGQCGQLGAEHHVGFGGRRVQVGDVANLVAAHQRSQHRHDRRDPGSGGEEQDRRRRRVGQHEIALGRGQPHDGPGFDAGHQVGGQEPLGHRLDGDGHGARRAGPERVLGRGSTSANTTASANARRPAVRSRCTGQAGSRS